MCEGGTLRKAWAGKEGEASSVEGADVLRNQAGGDAWGVAGDWITGVGYVPFLDLGAEYM